MTENKFYYPSKYDIAFTIDVKQYVFSGEETITFTANTKGKQLALDCVGLEIHKISLSQNNKQVPATYKVDKKTGKLVVTTSKDITKGEFSLFISFSGKLTDSLSGLYRCKYIVGNKEKYLATSQFEATEARKAFPCIDEPLYKAIFIVKVIADKNLTAISNTLPYKEVIQKNGKKLTEFNPSPRMSTYLLYVGVGEFEFVEEKMGKTLIRIVTTPGKKKYTKFAMECAKKQLQFFEEYFDYPYPLEKLDMIAILDFFANAMENWGAVTYRENRLLVYPRQTSKESMLRTAELMAHELAHMWYGNLVTMKDWGDLWLAESFAQFMGYKALAFTFPHWEVWSDYKLYYVYKGMNLDSLTSAHPISVKLTNMNDLDELFDDIAYGKGGGVLRMLERYIGEKAMRDGLRAFIQKYAYENAQAKDLWQAFEKAAKKPVEPILKHFLFRQGFPLLSVQMAQDDIVLTQHRFLYKGKEKSNPWNIPLHIQTTSKKVEDRMLEKQQESLLFDTNTEFININDNYSDFMISSYSDELEEKLFKHFGNLKPIDKLGIMHDYISLILSQEKSYKTFLDWVEKVVIKEKDAEVLYYLNENLVKFYNILRDERTKTVLESISAATITYFGIQPKKADTPLITQARTSALLGAIITDNKSVIKKLTTIFDAYITYEKSIHPDIQLPVFQAAMWNNSKNFSTLQKLYEKSDIQEQRIRILTALTFAKDQATIKKALAYAISSKVRFVHLVYPIAMVVKNPFAKDAIITWLLHDWDELIQQTGGIVSGILGSQVLKSIIPNAGVNSQKEINSYAKKNATSSLAKTIRQAIEELDIYQRFVDIQRYRK